MRTYPIRRLICSLITPVVVVPVLLLVLVSCGTAHDKFAPACPAPGLVKPLSQLDRYRSGSPDIRDLIVRARIADIRGKCEPGDDAGHIVTRIEVVVEVARGPALQGQDYNLPVFVAVTDTTDGAILDKTLFTLPVEFERNVDLARVTSKEIHMEIPVTPQKSGAAYGVVAGFQLTPEEVAAWRRNNQR